MPKLAGLASLPGFGALLTKPTDEAHWYGPKALHRNALGNRSISTERKTMTDTKNNAWAVQFQSDYEPGEWLTEKWFVDKAEAQQFADGQAKLFSNLVRGGKRYDIRYRVQHDYLPQFDK
tara:strand:+ start:57 stop:416 length:360 start_codon:yes stop_codon:yes gene_type:complete